MSTTYHSPVPLTIQQAVERTNWRPIKPSHKVPDDVTVLTDGYSFAWATEFQWEGQTYLDIEIYGLNDGEELTTALGLISDLDKRWWALPWVKEYFASDKEDDSAQKP